MTATTSPAAPTSPWRRRLGWLRYLLIVPIYTRYRQLCDERLRWRLASSHFTAVLLSISLVSVIGAALLVLAALIGSPSATEPSREAREVADLLESSEQRGALNPQDVSGFLSAITAGLIEANEDAGLMRIRFDFPGRFRHITSISVVGPDYTIRASSNRDLVGRTSLLISPMAQLVAQRALLGVTDLERTAVVQPQHGIVIGSAPLRNEEGAIIGAVVVDKERTTLPQGLDLLRVLAATTGQLGLILAIFVAIPALPVGIIAGVRRARSISEPVSELAAVADRVAHGDLGARVTVRGNDEIALLEQEFNEMAERLQGSLEQETALRNRAEGLLAANRGLISNVSHELRTPVALVRGHLEAAQADPAQAEDSIRIALRETDRLERLVDDLFQLTRIESKGIAVGHEPFDAASAAREAVESLSEPVRREAGITMLCNAPKQPIGAIGDRARLVQVLQNLIRNAIRHTPEGGIILVSAEREPDGDVLLQVRDTGEGIAPEHLPHIFDRFYRADSSRTRAAGGAGLGLAIAKELVEAMGGAIDVESAPGEGTVFSIRLPGEAVAAEG